MTRRPWPVHHTAIPSYRWPARRHEPGYIVRTCAVCGNSIRRRPHDLEWSHLA